MELNIVDYFLSVILVINNQKNIKESITKLSSKLEVLLDYEILIIDNSGDENTSKLLTEITGNNGLPNLQVFKLANQIEDYKARWLGFENSLGDHIICLDFDLINDLEIVDSMIKEINICNEIILVRSISKSRHKYKHFIYKLLGRLTRILLGINLNSYSSTTLAISRRILNYLLKFKNPELKFRNISSIKGIKKSIIRINYQDKSRDSLIKSLSRGLRLITSNSSLPLRFATFISSIGALFSILYSIYVIIIFISKENVAPGWASLSLQISIMFFCLSFVLLVMSEYILESLNTIYNKPKYFISEEFTSSNMTSKDNLNVRHIEKDKK